MREKLKEICHGINKNSLDDEIVDDEIVDNDFSFLFNYCPILNDECILPLQ